MKPVDANSIFSLPSNSSPLQDNPDDGQEPALAPAPGGGPLGDNVGKANFQLAQGNGAAPAVSPKSDDYYATPAYLTSLGSTEQRTGQMVFNFEKSIPAAGRNQFIQNRAELNINPSDVATAVQYLATIDYNTLKKISGIDRDSPEFADRLAMYTDLQVNLARAIKDGDQNLFNQTLAKYGGEAGLMMTAGDVARREKAVFDTEHWGEWSPKNTMNPLQGTVLNNALGVAKQLDAYGPEQGGRKLLLASMTPLGAIALAMAMKHQVKPIGEVDTHMKAGDPPPDAEIEAGVTEGEVSQAGTGSRIAITSDEFMNGWESLLKVEEGVSPETATAFYQAYKAGTQGTVMEDAAAATLQKTAGSAVLEDSAVSRIVKIGGDGMALIAVAFMIGHLAEMYSNRGTTDSPFPNRT